MAGVGLELCAGDEGDWVVSYIEEGYGADASKTILRGDKLLTIGGKSSRDFDEAGIQQALVGPPGGAVDLCLERGGTKFGVCLVRSRTPLHSSQVGWQSYLTRSKFPSDSKMMPPSIRLLPSSQCVPPPPARNMHVDDMPACQDSVVVPAAPCSPSAQRGSIQRPWEEVLDAAAAPSSTPHGPPPTPNHLFKSPDVYDSYNTKEMTQHEWAEPCLMAAAQAHDNIYGQDQEQEQEQEQRGEQQEDNDDDDEDKYGLHHHQLDFQHEIASSPGALFYSAKAKQCLAPSPTDCTKWAARLPDPDDACLKIGEMLGEGYRIVSCSDASSSSANNPLRRQPVNETGRSFVVQHVGCTSRSGDFKFYKAHLMPLQHEPPPKDSPDEEELLPKPINHPHVLPLYDAFFTPWHLCTVGPLVASTSLEHLIREIRSSPCSEPLSLSPAQLKRHFTAIASGLTELHGRHGVIHGCLTPRHCLLDPSGNLRIAGISLGAGPCEEYSPPEGGKSEAGDMWAVGCLLAEAASQITTSERNSGEPLSASAPAVRAALRDAEVSGGPFVGRLTGLLLAKTEQGRLTAPQFLSALESGLPCPEITLAVVRLVEDEDSISGALSNIIKSGTAPPHLVPPLSHVVSLSQALSRSLSLRTLEACDDIVDPNSSNIKNSVNVRVGDILISQTHLLSTLTDLDELTRCDSGGKTAHHPLLRAPAEHLRSRPTAIEQVLRAWRDGAYCTDSEWLLLDQGYPSLCSAYRGYARAAHNLSPPMASTSSATPRIRGGGQAQAACLEHDCMAEGGDRVGEGAVFSEGEGGKVDERCLAAGSGSGKTLLYLGRLASLFIAVALLVAAVCIALEWDAESRGGILPPAPAAGVGIGGHRRSWWTGRMKKGSLGPGQEGSEEGGLSGAVVGAWGKAKARLGRLRGRFMDPGPGAEL